MKMMTKRFLFMVRPNGETEIECGFHRPTADRIGTMLWDEPDGCKLYWIDVTVPDPQPEPEVIAAVVTEVQA